MDSVWFFRRPANDQHDQHEYACVIYPNRSRKSVYHFYQLQSNNNNKIKILF